MKVDKITWEQFFACTNDPRGVKYRFEDLCRQLFEYEFLSKNSIHKHVHSNPNNPGLESEPIYDEINQCWIGYQAKFFDNNVDYSQIQHSAEKIVQYYTGKVEKVYIFCNKPITSNCKSYEKVVYTLKEAGISTELVTDTTILDIVRKYDNLGLYYFGYHAVQMEWLEKHTEEILAKLGQRYNDELNVDTKAALELSLFSHDELAIRYLNDKKAGTMQLLEKLNWKYDTHASYKNKIEDLVRGIEDVTEINILNAMKWNNIIKTGVKDELEIFNTNIYTLEEKRRKLLSEIEDVTEEKKKKEIWDEIYEIRDKINIFENLVEVSDSLKLTDKEIELLTSKILIIEGKAGVGKSHLLANETVKLLENNRKALMLVGGDYLDNNSLMEQIRSNMSINYSFFDMIDLLNIDGENNNCIVPVYIDAINETWNKNLWKSFIPMLFNKIRKLENVRLVISFRSEYRKVLIDEEKIKKDDICDIIHRGFAEESFQATQAFLNHYGIPFTPLQMFNSSINNPLFLTLYCKTYQGDDVNLPLLYERLLNVANDNIQKSMSSALRNAGYDVCDDVVTPVIISLADFIMMTGQRYFSKDEISNLPIWKTNGISLRPFIHNLVRENILHNYMYYDEEILYFSYDQMNDYYCAKSILKKYKTRESLRSYIKEHVLGLKEKNLIKYENKDIFIYICILYSEKYGEECIDIIDMVEDEYDRRELFSYYIDSLQNRSICNISTNQFFEMCNKYRAEPEKVWDMFIGNSLKVNNNFNANKLHKILMAYPLNKRDFLWTEYINGLERASDNRLIQLIEMYNKGNGLDNSNKNQLELLLTLFGWLLTSSNRWLRDTTSKAMIEIIKSNFYMAEVLLKKFETVNDPYVIQRLYGIVWGACVKRENKNKEIYNSLTSYVYTNIFQAKYVYADILLRDYARLIVERFLYEFPEEEEHYTRRLIEPPYASIPVPQIDDQGYLHDSYDGGVYSIIRSMKFEGMGMYGDFGRYTFQAALHDFDVDYKKIFNYAVYYIINELGYNNNLFGDYDNNLGRYNYSRHNTIKVERIGKKYQWITMYNILARVADHYVKRDRFTTNKEMSKYDGPWEPYVRDFDPSLNEHFMNNEKFPMFNSVKIDEATFKRESEKRIESTQEEDIWIEEYPEFFDYQKSELIIRDEVGHEWIVLLKYADTKKKESSKDKLLIWNWIYGYFVTEEQYEVLNKYAKRRIDMVNDDITWFPETYTTYNREYPWYSGCAELNNQTHRNIKIRTGKKKEVTETYSLPDFSSIDKLLKECMVENDKEDTTSVDNVSCISKLAQLEIPKKEQTYTKKIDEVEEIGEIYCSYMYFLWEEEFDASKDKAISWIIPCAEIINDLKLQYGKCDGIFYDEDGEIATFDTSLSGQNAGLVIRKELLDLFLKKRKLKFVWFVNASKEIHLPDLYINKYSDWSGLLNYEDGKVTGEIFRKVDVE